MDKTVYTEMSQVEADHFWFRGRREVLKKLLVQRLEDRQIRAGARILDAGCATGGNLEWLSQFGEVWGVDSFSGACQVAAKKLPGQIIQGTLPYGLPFREKIFDLITLLDVLEHIEDDRGTLFMLRKIMKPNGMLLLTVPAFQCLWSVHDERHQHKRRYTIRQLAEMITDTGYEIEYISYFNTHLFPAIAGARILKNVFTKKGKSDLELPSPLINRFLFSIFSSEKKWIGRAKAPFGVSLVALARR